MLIYVCSQMRGMIPYTKVKYNRNLRMAAKYCRDVTEEGHIPIAPHLFFSAFLDERNPEGRKTGMRMGMELLGKCDEIWVFGAEDGISEGMKAEIEWAMERRMPVRYK